MSKLLEHFFNGMKNSIIVNTPNFDTNNQMSDAINISNDMRILMEKEVDQDVQKRKRKKIKIVRGKSITHFKRKRRKRK